MPDLPTTEAKTPEPATTVEPTTDGAAAEPGPRVSRARARTVPARPEPAPEAIPSAAFAPPAPAGAAPTKPTAAADDVVPVMAGPDAEIVRGAIGRLDARSVSVTQGAVGAGRTESLSLEMSAIGAAAAGEAQISRSIARAVMAGEVHLEQSAAQTVIAERVTMTGGSMALVVFARRVEGEVKPLLDWRGGLALGAALGVVLAILRPGRRRR